MTRRPGSSYRSGLGASTRENAGAFAFSIMITSAFGAVSALEPRPRAWEMFLFAAGGVAGFSLVAGLGSLRDDSETEAERTGVILLASILSFFSVLSGVGAAALLAWLLPASLAWPLGGLAASVAFLLVNAVEYAVAELEQD
jgi:4-hydroxybenzoate polyprenyltransferase